MMMEDVGVWASESNPSNCNFDEGHEVVSAYSNSHGKQQQQKHEEEEEHCLDPKTLSHCKRKIY
jgi:hypothetical protein